MLIHDEHGKKCYINLDQVVYAHIYEGSYLTEHRIKMTNGEHICVSEDEYARIIAYLDKGDYLTTVDSSI